MERRYPPKAILGTAYELATGRRLASTDFEGGRYDDPGVRAGIRQQDAGQAGPAFGG